MKVLFSKFQLIKAMLVVSLLMAVSAISAVNIRIDCDKPTVSISPLLYGIFFEDINFAADGGLYAELVQNRSFEYYPVPGGNPLSERYHPLYAWEKVERGGGKCTIKIDRIIPLNRNNLHYLVIDITNAADGVGVKNTGFDGIAINAGEKYDVSFYARREGRPGPDKITVSLELPDGTVCGSIEFSNIGGDWQKFQGVIKSDKTSDNAQLVLTTNNRGRLYLDMISLFPQKTFKGRKNGMRVDLAQALADLHPKFFRFPGGCISHGRSLQNAYRWKDTIGDVAQRRPNWNLWGYHQSYGLGYYEYFLLCEDIGAEPLPVLPVGVSCGFASPYQACPMEDLHVWIDDALDLIEFANGPTDSQWGKIRAEMGHPEPFELKYICLGNEEHDRPELRQRFPHFVKAIHKAYPDINIVGTSGLGPGIPLYDMMDELDVYSSDEHYYMNPKWFIDNQHRFDDFDRNAPKIFVGEYASQGNTQFNAVAEAAFLTGIERNGDIVDMACYAPLFANFKHTQWQRADLIWFDNRNLVKTANYYVQQLFSCNQGDVYLKNTVTEQVVQKTPAISGAVGIGTWGTAIEVQKAEVNGTSLDMSDCKTITGNFQMQDGLYVQTDAGARPAISLAKMQYNGDTVSYTVRARKTAGAEGFLLVFGAKDNDDYYWWNVGGWGNTQHGIEKIENGQASILTQRRGSIRNDIWYDMKVELTPGRICCYLDGELVHDYEIKHSSISVSSTLDKDANDIIVKLVNPTEDDVDAVISLDGIKRVDSSATLKIIAGPKSAKNTIEQPDMIKTQTRLISVGKKFAYTMPAISVQFIRIKLK